MRLALLSDLHANRQALDACLSHARSQGADRFAFLGDLVGYGADPVGVLDQVMALQAQGAWVLQGNHDAMAGAAADFESATWSTHFLSIARPPSPNSSQTI